jgi:hypothetical protein
MKMSIRCQTRGKSSQDFKSEPGRNGCAVEIVAGPQTAGFFGDLRIFCAIFLHCVKFLG